jgi:hypothetical protein
MKVGGLCHALVTLLLGKRPRRLDGPQDRSGQAQKITPHPDLIPGLLSPQQVPTKYAILAH